MFDWFHIRRAGKKLDHWRSNRRADALPRLGETKWTQIIRGDAEDFERLGASMNSGALKKLRELLENGDVDVRKAAAETLAASTSDVVVEPLIEAMADAELRVRKAAAAGLGKHRDRRAVEPLVKAMEDDEGVLSAAGDTLATLGDEAAVKPLVRILGKEGSRRRAAVARVLGQLGRLQWPQWIRSDSDDFRRLSGSNDPDALNVICRALELGDPESRRLAAAELGRVAHLNAIEALIKALGQDGKEIRKIAAHSLIAHAGSRPDLIGKNWNDVFRRIRQEHTDRNVCTHYVDYSPSDCTDSTYEHTDYGIGLPFPEKPAGLDF